MKTLKGLLKIREGKAYTSAQLRRAVEAYFLSISYMEEVTTEEPVILRQDEQTGAVEYLLDKYGHRVYRTVPLCNEHGEPMRRLCYVTPPGEYGLCQYLGIDKAQWDAYAESEDPELRLIHARAGGHIRAYLETAAESKAGKGAQFKLERMYGLSQKVDVDTPEGGSVEKFLQKIGGSTKF